MTPSHERIFLGFEPALLARAADRIVERFGRDMAGLLVTLPGAGAARVLREHLARRADMSAIPARVLTQGDLTDELVQLDRPVAGRLARTLAWARALRELPRAEIEAIAARPPSVTDLRGWTRLAEAVRALHAELAQEGIDFARLAGDRKLPGGPGEAARWRALALAQESWRRSLADLRLEDPHESRFRAIEAGRVDLTRRVVLVGVADANRLLRRALERLGERVTAIVFAPDSEAESFDEIGCVRTESWKDRDLCIPLDRWAVADGPADQADRAIDFLAGWNGRFAPEDVSIGVCDEEVAPYLERRLREEGVPARDAAGTPLERTRPCRLLADLAAWLPRRAFAPYAALLRTEPGSFLRTLRVESAAIERGETSDLVPHLLDRYHEEHLPGTIDGRWLGPEGAAMRPVHDALVASLGPLASGEPRPLAQWSATVRAFLAASYPGDLDRSVEEQRVLVETLAAISDALGEIETLPGELGTSLATPAEALELLLAMLAAGSVPPRPEAPGESAVEMAGWLELPLDAAPALVVTGFQEGFVPRSRRGDAFLPDSLRRRLGLPSADDRVARDLYAATVLLRSRTEVAFVSGRRSRDGDPLLPSRLAFHAPRGELLARAERMRRAEHGVAPHLPRPIVSAAVESYGLPRVEPPPQLGAMWVTAFRDYLCSPYGFYLKHVLCLETLDDASREMDPREFGSLAHAVLEGFGRSDLRDSTREGEIEAWLRGKVEELSRQRFGDRPLPAVELQLAQLARRLALFARAQANRAAEGWRIRHVEWRPQESVFLQMSEKNGESEAPMRLLGKIDRIDVREAPGSKVIEWTILDYKTSGVARDPGKVHRVRGEWRDLQLPLYTLLAQELGFEAMPSLGYFTIGKDGAETVVKFADWETADLEEAYEAARDVVRRVRKEDFFDLGRQFPDEPILLAIAGKGLVAGPEVENGERNGESEGGTTREETGA